MQKFINVDIYSDGACSGNPGPGGYAAIITKDHLTKIVVGNEKSTTNNQMELKAVVEALKALKTPCNIKLYSDSSYVVKAINEWLVGWIKKGWRTTSGPVANKDLWLEYLEHSKVHKIEAIWVKAHNGHEMNERVDKLAVEQRNLVR